MNINYTITRIKGMRSHLLTKTDYETLIHQTSIDSLASYLLRTSYHDKIQLIYSNSNPIKTLKKVFSYYFKDQMDSIKDIVSEPYSNWISWKLRKWDLLNIKTAIRMAKDPLKNEQSKQYLLLYHQCPPLGDFNENDLKSLFNLDDLNELRNFLNSINSPFYEVFKEIDENQFNNGIMKIENKLNKYYFTRMLNIVRTIRTKSIFKLSKKSPLLKMIEEEIDFENIKIALRWIRAYKFESSSIDSFPFKEIFIPGGGKFNIKMVSDYLEEGNFEKVVELINQFPYFEVSISDIYKELEMSGLDYESKLERDFLRSQIKKKYDFRTKSNVLFSYYYSLMTEFTNLDIIMYGINGRIDPQILTKRVIINA